MDRPHSRQPKPVGGTHAGPSHLCLAYGSVSDSKHSCVTPHSCTERMAGGAVLSGVAEPSPSVQRSGSSR